MTRDKEKERGRKTETERQRQKERERQRVRGVCLSTKLQGERRHYANDDASEREKRTSSSTRSSVFCDT